VRVSETSKSIALALAIVVVAAAPAQTQQIGTATAVNPSTEGTPPGGSTTTLTIGARVLHKERIHTSSTGSMQLLFLDKSTLSIAPNTSLVIDEFVYDPASNSGHMLTKLTQGTLQYIGGELSHQGAVTVETPAAAIGIRGGIMNASHSDGTGTEVINQYGTLTIQNGSGNFAMTRSGFMMTIADWNAPLGPAVPVTQDRIVHYQKILSSAFGQTGGGPPINGLPTTGPPPTWWSPTNTGDNGALQIIIESTQRATQPNPPPPPPPTDFSRVR
jgi:FecR protein